MFVLSTLSAFGLIWYGHTSYLPQAPIFLDLMQKYAYLPILGIFLGAFCYWDQTNPTCVNKMTNMMNGYGVVWLVGIINWIGIVNLVEHLKFCQF